MRLLLQVAELERALRERDAQMEALNASLIEASACRLADGCCWLSCTRAAAGSTCTLLGRLPAAILQC